jgi:hypothetical protein
MGSAKIADTTLHSRGAMRPSFAKHCPSKTRGRREDRVRAAPAVSRANAHSKNAHEHTGSAETLRPSLRSGFNGFLRALLGEPGFLATVISGSLPANLTPASGCQDHTTSPSAASIVVRCANAHPTQLRPPHPVPNVHDDREAPLLWARDGVKCAADLGVRSICDSCDTLTRRANQQLSLRANVKRSREAERGRFSVSLIRPTRCP